MSKELKSENTFKAREYTFAKDSRYAKLKLQYQTLYSTLKAEIEKERAIGDINRFTFFANEEKITINPLHGQTLSSRAKPAKKIPAALERPAEPPSEIARASATSVTTLPSDTVFTLSLEGIKNYFLSYDIYNAGNIISHTPSKNDALLKLKQCVYIIKFLAKTDKLFADDPFFEKEASKQKLKAELAQLSILSLSAIYKLLLKMNQSGSESQVRSKTSLTYMPTGHNREEDLQGLKQHLAAHQHESELHSAITKLHTLVNKTELLSSSPGKNL